MLGLLASLPTYHASRPASASPRRVIAQRVPPTRMALAAAHRTVAVGEEDSMLLKLVYDTDHAEADALPCVMLLSGADCPHESYMWLAARLAEAGCAVALSSCVVPFGPGTCILSTPFDLSALGSLESYMRNPARAGLEARWQRGGRALHL